MEERSGVQGEAGFTDACVALAERGFGGKVFFEVSEFRRPETLRLNTVLFRATQGSQRWSAVFPVPIRHRIEAAGGDLRGNGPKVGVETELRCGKEALSHVPINRPYQAGAGVHAG